VLKDQGNCFPKACETFLAGCALPVCSGDFSAIRDVPWAILLHNRREFVAHTRFLPLSKHRSIHTRGEVKRDPVGPVESRKTSRFTPTSVEHRM